MSESLDERTLATLESLLPAYDDFPYLWTRVVTGFYHIIPLPATVDEATLRTFARYQLTCNQLPTCLVLGPRTSIYINPYGLEEISNCIPRGGIVVDGQLAPWAGIEQTDWCEAKSNRLKAYVARQVPSTRSTYILGDLTKGGRPATPEELTCLAGLNADGVPNGLSRCPICSGWKGQCLDPSPTFHGQLMTVVCRCENDNRCARCYRFLAERKLNANYYKESDGSIWHVPGFMGFDHRCDRR